MSSPPSFLRLAARRGADRRGLTGPWRRRPLADKPVFASVSVPGNLALALVGGIPDRRQ